MLTRLFGDLNTIRVQSDDLLYANTLALPFGSSAKVDIKPIVTTVDWLYLEFLVTRLKEKLPSDQWMMIYEKLHSFLQSTLSNFLDVLAQLLVCERIVHKEGYQLDFLQLTEFNEIYYRMGFKDAHGKKGIIIDVKNLNYRHMQFGNAQALYLMLANDLSVPEMSLKVLNNQPLTQIKQPVIWISPAYLKWLNTDLTLPIVDNIRCEQPLTMRSLKNQKGEYRVLAGPIKNVIS